MLSSTRTPLHLLVDLPVDFRLADLPRASTDWDGIAFHSHSLQPIDRLEAVINGLTFELDLHSADRASSSPQCKRLDSVYLNGANIGLCSRISLSLHDHVASAASTRPVNRSMLRLARLIGEAVHARAVIWTPARQIIGFDYFAELVTDYERDGRFPLLLQVNCAETATGKWRTHGLDYFIGQELELGATPSIAAGEMLRRLVRLVHRALAGGSFTEQARIPGIWPGERYSISLSPNGDLVRITVITPAQPVQAPWMEPAAA